jgi:hypothetical protein
MVDVTLLPDGRLGVALPGTAGTQRILPLHPGHEVESLKRILQAQAEGQQALGEDGAPTKQQLWHQERHQIWPNDRCPFCPPCTGSGRKRLGFVCRGEVKVRRLAPLPGLKTKKTLEDIFG